MGRYSRIGFRCIPEHQSTWRERYERVFGDVRATGGLVYCAVRDLPDNGES